ncbi:MAG: DUF1080 domain-containing protein [Planctomycetes bacterium]|nr:DUF1080 domain-containing protein [Planctomycetota bacterium]
MGWLPCGEEVILPPRNDYAWPCDKSRTYDRPHPADCARCAAKSLTFTALRFVEAAPDDGKAPVSVRSRGGIVTFVSRCKNDTIWRAEGAEHGDFTLTATLKITAGPSNVGNGVLFRFKEGRFFSLQLANTGHCALWAWDGKKYDSLKLAPDQTEAWLICPAIKRNAANTVTVRARGEEIRVSINGVEIGGARSSLSASGAVGLHVFGGCTVEYSDVKIARLGE